MTSFRKINNKNNIEMIATWIYQTEYSFNRLFFNDSVRAVTGIERLIMSDTINPYHRKFITICYDDDPNEILGIVVGYKGSDVSFDSKFKAIYDTSCSEIALIFLNEIANKLNSSTVKPDEYYIGNLYVDPKHRNKHIGSKLVQYSKRIAKQGDSNKVILDVKCEKKELLDYYRKLGFEVSGTNFYRFFGKIEGCYAMSCELCRE